LAEPPAAVALRRVLAWQAEIQSGAVTQADIARREGYTRARITQLMKLTRLPDQIKQMLLANDPSTAGMTVTRAIELTGTWRARIRLITSEHQERAK
jgi:ParB-like chromosome segregation protein Spo0J